jgi:hypothetical protein
VKFMSQESTKQMIAESFNEIADAIKSGKFGKKS